MLARPPGDRVRLTLGYRATLAWDALVASIAADTPPGLGVVDRSRYGRTVALEGCRGVVFLEAAPAPQVHVSLSVSLLPALMPLLARLRHLLDLDAEPAVIDADLADGGLAALVARRPGLRLPGAFDGFEVAARELLGPDLLRRVRAAAPRGAAAAVERLRRRASLLRLRNVVEPQRMAEHPKLPRDLRRKVLQHLDELEPAVQIQAGS